MEKSKKRADFTTSQYHHSKLFLHAHLVTRDQLHEDNSKESSAVTANAVGEMRSSQGRKNSGKPDSGIDLQMGIDIEALEEVKKAGIDPTPFLQMKVLKQFEAKQKQKLAKPKKNKEMIECRKRVQEAKNELKMEDWSGLDISMLDNEKQKKIYEEATHDRKMQEEKMLQENIMLQEENSLQEEATASKSNPDHLQYSNITS